MQDCLQMPAETKYRCARGINRRRTRASVGNIIGVGGNVVRKWGRAKRPRAGDAAITPAKRRARAKPETVQLRLPRWVAIFLRLLQDCWLSLQTNREHKRSSNTHADKQITSTNTAQKWTCACHLAFSCVVVSAPTCEQRGTAPTVAATAVFWRGGPDAIGDEPLPARGRGAATWRRRRLTYSLP